MKTIEQIEMDESFKLIKVAKRIKALLKANYKPYHEAPNGRKTNMETIEQKCQELHNFMDKCQETFEYLDENDIDESDFDEEFCGFCGEFKHDCKSKCIEQNPSTQKETKE